MTAVKITEHARERMLKYQVSERLVIEAIEKPSSVLESHSGRRIYQMRLNGYLLRVISDESERIRRIITVYKAKRERYEI